MPSTTTAGTTFDSTSWDVEADFVYWDLLRAATDPNVPDAYLLKCSCLEYPLLSVWVSRPRRTPDMRSYLVNKVSFLATGDIVALPLLRDRELSAAQLVELARSTSTWQPEGPARAVAVIDHPNTTAEAIAWALCQQPGAQVRAAAAAKGSLLPFAFHTDEVRRESVPLLKVPEAMRVAAELEAQVLEDIRSLVAALAVTWRGSFETLLDVARDAIAA